MKSVYILSRIKIFISWSTPTQVVVLCMCGKVGFAPPSFPIPPLVTEPRGLIFFSKVKVSFFRYWPFIISWPCGIANKKKNWLLYSAKKCRIASIFHSLHIIESDGMIARRKKVLQCREITFKLQLSQNTQKKLVFRWFFFYLK